MNIKHDTSLVTITIRNIINTNEFYFPSDLTNVKHFIPFGVLWAHDIYPFFKMYFCEMKNL